MRTVRYIFAVLLFLMAFIASGERYVYHIAYFDQSFFGITFSYGTYSLNDSNVLAKEKLRHDLQKYQFDIFYVEKKYPSNIREEITVYGTEGAIDHLKEQGIEEKTYHSFFIGEVQVVFRNFEEISAIREDDVFCYIGTVGDAAAFKAQTTDEVNHSDSYYSVDKIDLVSGSDDGLYVTLALVWGVAFGLVLLLTLFFVVLKRKETFVKITLGASPGNIFWGNVLLDSALFSVSFGGLAYLLRDVAYTSFHFSYIFIGFIVMLTVNAMLYLLVFRRVGERGWKAGNEDRSLLGVAYVVKALSLCLTCVILSVNLAVIVEAVEYFQQREYFDALDGYQYYKLSLTEKTRQTITDRHYEQNVWYQLDQEFGDNAIYLVDQTDQIEENAVLINRNAIPLLSPHIHSDIARQLKEATEEKLYVFFPSDFSEERAQNALEIGKALFLRGREENSDLLAVSSYEKGERIFTISENRHLYRSSFLQDPIIFLDNTVHEGTGWYANPLYTAPDLLYRISEDEIHDFLQRTRMEGELITITSAQDVYAYHCEGMVRSCKLLSAVSLFLAALESGVTIFLVRLEYSIHGLAFAIKKTLGYGIFERSKRLFLIPIVLVPICTTAAVIIESKINVGNQRITLLLGGIILLVEIGLTVFQSFRFDHLQTQLVLKGGNL